VLPEVIVGVACMNPRSTSLLLEPHKLSGAMPSAANDKEAALTGVMRGIHVAEFVADHVNSHIDADHPLRGAIDDFGIGCYVVFISHGTFFRMPVHITRDQLDGSASLDLTENVGASDGYYSTAGGGHHDIVPQTKSKLRLARADPISHTDFVASRAAGTTYPFSRIPGPIGGAANHLLRLMRSTKRPVLQVHIMPFVIMPGEGAVVLTNRIPVVRFTFMDKRNPTRLGKGLQRLLRTSNFPRLLTKAIKEGVISAA
jgi:hypothetical protein